MVLGILSSLIAAASYTAFYVASPGRQAVNATHRRTKLVQGVGWALAILATALSVPAFGPFIGPVLVLTVMMTVASILALVGPFFNAAS